MQGLTLPVAEYRHAAGDCSVSGGFVGRRAGVPGAARNLSLRGLLQRGRIWGVERQANGWTNRQLLASGFTITTFGEDEAGDIHFARLVLAERRDVKPDDKAAIVPPLALPLHPPNLPAAIIPVK